MKILIASPSYDGSVRKEYMRAVMDLTHAFDGSGIRWELLIESATVLHTMRSVMASKALMDDGFTHLLFLDTDMGFAPRAVQKLLEAGQEVVGCAYPYRTIPLHQKPEMLDKTLRQVIAESVPYAVRFAPGTRDVQVVDGLCEVAGLGTGLMLIARGALQKLVDAGAVERYRVGFPYGQFHRHPHYYGFFDHWVENGTILGEDYSFCQRWTSRCQGKIHAVVSEEVMHVGALPVLGRYSDRLRTGKL